RSSDLGNRCRRCHRAAGSGACGEPGRSGSSVAGVPRPAAAVRECRREGARTQSAGARLVGNVEGAVIAPARLLAPDALLLIVAVAADLALGDPAYCWHPIRLVGAALTWTEGRLRAAGCDRYGGGVLLFGALATTS